MGRQTYPDDECRSLGDVSSDVTDSVLSCRMSRLNGSQSSSTMSSNPLCREKKIVIYYHKSVILNDIVLSIHNISWLRMCVWICITYSLHTTALCTPPHPIITYPVLPSTLAKKNIYANRPKAMAVN